MAVSVPSWVSDAVTHPACGTVFVPREVEAVHCLPRWRDMNAVDALFSWKPKGAGAPRSVAALQAPWAQQVPAGSVG